MKNEDKLAEQFAILHGWEKVKGYKFDNGGLDDWDEVYFSKEDLKTRLKDCEFWQYTEAEEVVYEDVWQVVEYIEDNIVDANFDNYKKSMKSSGGKEE